MSRYDLTDFEWRVIKPLLPNKPRGVPCVDDLVQLASLLLWLRAYGSTALSLIGRRRREPEALLRAFER
jgi:transposase